MVAGFGFRYLSLIFLNRKGRRGGAMDAKSDDFFYAVKPLRNTKGGTKAHEGFVISLQTLR